MPRSDLRGSARKKWRVADRPIITLPSGESILRRQNRKVKIIDKKIQELIDDMIETMHSADGVGLAAPQIGANLKICVIAIPDEPVITLINPQIVKRSGERTLEEGCLSIPGYWGEVVRSQSVVAKGKNRKGTEIRVRARDDVLAQALEHEIDHLNGKLYIDLLASPDQVYRVADPAAE